MPNDDDIRRATYTLEDRYARDQVRVFLNGHQAMVRVLLMQHERDRAAGLHTAGFVSGYRGSPLGVLDLALWNAGDRLRARDHLPTGGERGARRHRRLGHPAARDDR